MQAPPQLSTTPPQPGVVTFPAINNALQTIATDFSGDTDPAALAWPLSKWADTSTGLLKRRNAAGTEWVVEGSLFSRALNMIPSDEIPTNDQGDILVQGGGRMRWFAGTYAPNNLPTRYRDLTRGVVTRSTTSCTIAPGAWRDLEDRCDLILESSLSKTLQASGPWTAGSGNNGLFSGARANSTMYYLFVIRKDSDGSIDAGFDTSISADNRPAGYSAFRRVAACWFASGAFSPCIQAGDEFLYSPRLMLFSNAGWGSGWNSGAPVTAPVPAGVPVELHMKATLGTSSNLMAFGPTGSSGTPPSGGFDVIGQAAGGSGAVTVPVDLPVSDGKIVIYLSSPVASGTWCALTGYRDFLGD